MPSPVTFREDQARERTRRIRAMHERYSEGLTLAEVGAEFGVTKERVRQLFVDQGLPTRDSWESRRLSRP